MQPLTSSCKTEETVIRCCIGNEQSDLPFLFRCNNAVCYSFMSLIDWPDETIVYLIFKFKFSRVASDFALVENVNRRLFCSSLFLRLLLRPTRPSAGPPRRGDRFQPRPSRGSCQGIISFLTFHINKMEVYLQFVCCSFYVLLCT